MRPALYRNRSPLMRWKGAAVRLVSCCTNPRNEQVYLGIYVELYCIKGTCSSPRLFGVVISQMAGARNSVLTHWTTREVQVCLSYSNPASTWKLHFQHEMRRCFANGTRFSHLLVTMASWISFSFFTVVLTLDSFILKWWGTAAANLHLSCI